MSREIKFRIWSKPLEQMFPVAGLQFAADGTISKVQMFPNGEFHDANQFEIMEYTGLKSKSGVEIYEGDVVRYRDDYDGLTVTAILRTLDDFSAMYFGNAYGEPTFDEERSECQVIGNIYQNRELLDEN